MTRLYGSQSMVAPLHTVLVKRPEQAFAVGDPVAWHYTGRPDVTIAQQEHDALVALLRQGGAEVVYHDEPQPDVPVPAQLHGPQHRERRRGIVVEDRHQARWAEMTAAAAAAAAATCRGSEP